MGQIRFVVPQRDRLSGDQLRRVYLSGMEGIPWRSSCRWPPSEAAERGGSAGADARASTMRRPLPAFLDGPTTDKQRAWAEQLLALLLAKPYVQGVVSNQRCDVETAEFSHGGLLDARQQPKPVSAALAAIKQQHLM
jgi:hypothetical protein